ncbi:MAG: hypothetical protein K8W52_36575 [Deltaproteobacteria bacterium]|nr:hypothetical protein [Deltaproteobacteria bacterium]
MLRSIALALALVGTAACVSAAEGALDVPLGLPRDQVPAAVRRYDFCVAEQGSRAEQTFPRCKRPGIDYLDAWIVAGFDGGRLMRLSRWERWDDDTRAVDRWNALIAARTKMTGPASDEAKTAVLAQHELPPGTRAWQAFRASDHMLVAIYLLTPIAPANASVLEELVGAPMPGR